MKVIHSREKEGGTEQVLNVIGVQCCVSDSRSCVFFFFQGPDVLAVYCSSFKSDLESFNLWTYVIDGFKITIQIETI